MASTSTFANGSEKYQIHCINSAKESFALTYKPATNVVFVTNTEYFGHAQILKNQAFGLRISNWQELSFTYSWYYDANYSFRFSEPLLCSQ